MTPPPHPAEMKVVTGFAPDLRLLGQIVETGKRTHGGKGWRALVTFVDAEYRVDLKG